MLTDPYTGQVYTDQNMDNYPDEFEAEEKSLRQQMIARRKRFGADPGYDVAGERDPEIDSIFGGGKDDPISGNDPVSSGIELFDEDPTELLTNRRNEPRRKSAFDTVIMGRGGRKRVPRRYPTRAQTQAMMQQQSIMQQPGQPLPPNYQFPPYRKKPFNPYGDQQQ